MERDKQAEKDREEERERLRIQREKQEALRAAEEKALKECEAELFKLYPKSK